MRHTNYAGSRTEFRIISYQCNHTSLYGRIIPHVAISNVALNKKTGTVRVT
jgi:hypothetical protein